MPALWSRVQRFELPPERGNRTVLEIAPGVPFPAAMIEFASDSGYIGTAITDFRTPLLVVVDHTPDDPETVLRVEVRG
jgi:hypothetical protein